MESFFAWSLFAFVVAFAVMGVACAFKGDGESAGLCVVMAWLACFGAIVCAI